jgi:type II secretion system-associated lipoprotein
MVCLKEMLWFMRFQKKFLLPFVAIAVFSCTLNYIKDDELKSLDKEFEGVYVTVKEIDVGNNNKIPAGTMVRLYFNSTSTSVKVYAYDEKEVREKALGKLILYMFDTDFPDKIFLKELMVKKLFEIVKRVK